MFQIPLPVPLRFLGLCRFRESDGAEAALVERCRELLDDAAFSRRVPSFEDDEDFEASMFDPELMFLFIFFGGGGRGR